jgi:retron-type reverse transcriptase
MIAKTGGGERALGIPTVVDRLIQQAVHEVVSLIFEKDFSESSYGYRSKRSAQQAVETARRYVSEGRRWVVDIDLEKFFDRVNHDILMARVVRKVKDKRILLLIRRYLQVGIREHKFCRYADDSNIYVHTQRAGERVKESVTLFLSNRLKLKVNEAKSAVDRPWKRKFLGYTITMDKDPRLRASKQSIMKLKDTLRVIFRRGRGRNIGRLIMEELNPVIRGWGNYFSLTRVKKIPEELDFWIRRKLRCIIWR